MEGEYRSNTLPPQTLHASRQLTTSWRQISLTFLAISKKHDRNTVYVHIYQEDSKYCDYCMLVNIILYFVLYTKFNF